MVRNYLLSLLFITLLSCEQHSKSYNQLIAIDSLLMNDQTDSALYLINMISIEGMDEETTAYYRLLKAQCQYKTYQPDLPSSLIDSALSYYEKKDDKEKLARSLYYKGSILNKMDKQREAIEQIEKAKRLILGSNNNILLHHIFYKLAIINNKNSEYNLAKDNALRALFYSLKKRKRDHLMSDYLLLSSCYYNLGNMDSCQYYTEKCIKLINSIPSNPKTLRANAWASLGINYYPIDKVKSEEFLEKSMSIVPVQSAYGALGRLKLKKGDTLTAKNLFEEGIKISKAINIKVDNLLWLSKLEQEAGNYQRAHELSKLAYNMQDSLNKAQREENIRAQQIEYDRIAEKEQTSDKLFYALIAIVTIIVIGSCISWYLVRRKREITRELSSTHEKLDIAQEQLLSSQEELRFKDKKLRSANKKLANAEKKQKEIRKEQLNNEKAWANGHKLYTDILFGGKINQWTKKDFTELFSYYQQMDPEFAEFIDNNYEKLTPNEYLLLLLLHIGKSDNDIMKTMCLTLGAFHTTKSRIHKKKVLS